jgi:putative SOS response-associated peptidase YedK
VPAIRLNEEKHRELVLLKWGLIPSWSNDAKIAYSTINARSDTVATKPAFRSAYKKRRCLILADGYYEWLREGKDRQPFFYEVDGGKPFAMAGLWEWWGGPEGKNEPVESCTIITTDANKLASEIHDRMPVILDEKDYDTWLSCGEVSLVPFTANRMKARPVSRYVNKVGNEGEGCLAGPQ